MSKTIQVIPITNMQSRIINSSRQNPEIKVLPLPWLGLWRSEDYTKAVLEKSITLYCQLIYTDEELREILTKSQKLHLKFKDTDHYRTYLFLELCKKLPEPVYTSIFKYFHEIVQVRDLTKSPAEDFQVAIMIHERYQLCPLTQDIMMAL